MKRRLAAAGAVLCMLFLSVFLFNRWVLSVSSGYLKNRQYSMAGITAQAVIPFDPFLYILTPGYGQYISGIRTGESIRRFALFHPVTDENYPDTEYMNGHIYEHFREYTFTAVWNAYSDMFRENGIDERPHVLEGYDAFFRSLKKPVPQKDKGLYEQILMYHADYMRRIDMRKDMFANISFYMNRFCRTGSARDAEHIINLLRDFDTEFELRYSEKQPLHYVHGTLIRNTVLFQAYAIQYMQDRDNAKLKNMYEKTLKTVIASRLFGD